MEAEKAKSKKQIELQKQRKQKKPVVVKVKRKRDETPDEALVIESRISKKTKVNFLDSFKKLNLCDGPTNQDTYTTTKKYFRYFGTGNNTNFDVTAKIKEVNAIALNPALPPVYSMKQLNAMNANNNSSSAVTNAFGQIANKEFVDGIDIIEIDRPTDDAGPNDNEEYHYYYMDEDVSHVEKYKNNAIVIQVESFLVDDEINEYDEDDFFDSDDRSDIDYPDTPSSDGGLNSWEDNSSDSNNDGYYGRRLGRAYGAYGSDDSDSYESYYN